MRKPVIKVENDRGQGSSTVLRQFSRKVSGSGILRTVRAERYHVRGQSELAEKRRAIKRITKRIAMNKLIKLGKAPIKKIRGRR